MSDELKLPQVGGLTFPQWQDWLVRYNAVLGERERRIEKLVEENGVLFAANVRLSSRADLDSDGQGDRIKKLKSGEEDWNRICNSYAARINKLEAALREIIGALNDPKGGQHVYDMRNASYIARKALEGKDDAN